MPNYKISIVTPTHNIIHLSDLWETIKNQTYENWEWVIIANGGAVIPDFKDKRIKIYNFEYGGGKVGSLKRYGCEMATGEIYLEVDHDDLLTPDALDEVNKAFQDKEICFVYSNCANVNVPAWTPVTWSESFGWTYKPFQWKDHNIIEAISAEPDPQSISRIWFAPNHLRAWRAKDYWKIGGHNQNMKISDDHDLMMRTYIYGKMKHIDKCLYIYQVWGNNTWLQNMQEIEDTMWDCYNKYIWQMAETWADRNKLKKIDLCGAIDKKEGYLTKGVGL